ncbi:MAG TPA: MarR family winged helix-turn-helix transcriptional regulator [Brevundimonas sp.]|jgi:DNA-binding MarR family transcriptional regulator|uniref:MarR family winged helix-turn-helix transcriptional regulator n=1 Tax=Brevundimonas sp. TaxID=1871086 RepID=UPI002E12CB7D|nr:MarR family winged helix-turn-helix transcriptional regulator [Brevundimonas sp.]
MVKGKKAEATLGALARSPSHQLHRVLQLALDIYAEETGPDAPTQRQFAVLEACALKDGLTQTDLVKATGIDRSTLADLVARMTTKGLLVRERSVIDARANAVSLSPEGRAALEAARPRVEAADRRILALLPKGRREAFLEVLGELAAAAESAPAEAEAAAKAARKAEKEARKAEKAARKAAEALERKAAKAKGKGARRKGDKARPDKIKAAPEPDAA